MKIISRRHHYRFTRSRTFAILIDHETAFSPRLARHGQAHDRQIFDFDAPGFWPLIHDVRYSALDAAAANGVPLLVTTFCYAEPEDREQFGKFEAIMQRHGGELLPVFLHCSREEAMRRVGNPDRVERRKMASGEALANYLDSNHFTAAPRADCLKLDTGAAPAEVTAQKIVDHFGLNVPA